MLHGESVRRESSDVELLGRAGRDPEAFRAFYQRYALALTLWLERQTGQREVALDITAETFARALAGLDRFRAETGETAAPWLYGIAANLLRRYWGEQTIETRYRRQLGVLEQTRFAADTELESIERLDASAISERLAAALDALPPAYREAVKLRVVDEFSYREAADRMETSETTARVRVHRGLRALAHSKLRRDDP
jgi:RNA polymerase sigma factor (sigma-70 family)